jgi:hypothetical protein
VTLPEVVTGELAGKFGKILLFDQHADFEPGFASNSNSTPRGLPCASRLLSHHMWSPQPCGPPSRRWAVSGWFEWTPMPRSIKVGCVVQRHVH